MKMDASLRIDTDSAALPLRSHLYAAGESDCPGLHTRINEKQYLSSAIGVVAEGHFTYRVGAGEAFVSPGAVVFGNVGEEFAFRHLDTRGNRRAVLALNHAALVEVANDCGMANARFPLAILPPSRDAATWFADVEHLATVQHSNDERALSIAAAALRLTSSAPLPTISQSDVRRVLQVARYVEEFHWRPCELRELATLADLSRYHFIRVFKNATGTSPRQYVINARLRAAAAKLRQSRAPITAIAFEVGFNDISHFNHTFRRQFGVSPRGWRDLT